MFNDTLEWMSEWISEWMDEVQHEIYNIVQKWSVE